MNNTIKCWLIANLETLLGICFLTFLFCSAHGSSGTANPSTQANIQIPTSWKIIIGSVVIIAIYFSVKIATYTYRNFDEVVSRRMLWRNSNVSMFQEQLKYSLSRFGYAFFTISLFIFDLALPFIK
jgi:hypothetical protein